MEELTYWDVIKNFYKTKFNIPPKYIDFIACYPVLLGCVVGYSNASISRRNKIPEDYVQEILIDFFGFTGWKIDLDISPYAIYKRAHNNFDLFCQEVLVSSAYFEFNDIKFLFKLCSKFRKLKEWADEVEKSIL